MFFLLYIDHKPQLKANESAEINPTDHSWSNSSVFSNPIIKFY